MLDSELRLPNEPAELELDAVVSLDTELELFPSLETVSLLCELLVATELLRPVLLTAALADVEVAVELPG